MVKFGLVTPDDAMDRLKICLDDFMGHNPDLASNFLEACGPFLVSHKDEAVTRRINNLLDFLWRLKEKEFLSTMQLNNIESAYFLCRPSKASQASLMQGAKKGETLSVIHQYIQHLFLERIPQAASNYQQSKHASTKDPNTAPASDQ